MKPLEIASLSNSRWQNRLERPNRSTDIGDIDIKSVCEIEPVSSI